MIVVCLFLNVIVVEYFGVHLPILETALIEQSAYLFLFVEFFNDLGLSFWKHFPTHIEFSFGHVSFE